MTKMPLTQGKFALVDDGDFEYLNQWKWYFEGRYAVRNNQSVRGKIYLHREILKTPEGYETDHINGDKLDNRRDNLRICTKSENAMNREASPKSSSGLKGVCWSKDKNKWIARIKANRKTVFLGYFDDKITAAKIYNKKVEEYHGEFGKLNNV